MHLLLSQAVGVSRATQRPTINNANSVARFGCSQFVHMVDKPYPQEDRFIRQCLLDGDNAFRQQSKVNQDGWGIAVYQGPERLSIWKSALKAKLDPLFKRKALEASRSKPMVTLSHLRMGTPVQVSNNHPFPIGQAIMMHNGFIPDQLKDGMQTELAEQPVKHQLPKLAGTTDTEVFVRHLQADMVKRFGTDNPTEIPTDKLAELFNQRVSGLINASKNIPDDGPMRIGYNFTLVDDHRIIASRHGRPLHLGIRKSPDSTHHKTDSSPSKESHLKASPLQDVIVATNPMQVRSSLFPWRQEKKIQWTEIPTDHMVIIERMPPQGAEIKRPEIKIEFQKLKTDISIGDPSLIECKPQD